MADNNIHFLIVTQDTIDQGLEMGIFVILKGHPYWGGFYLIADGLVYD